MSTVDPAERRRAFAALLTAGVLWGTTFALGKHLMQAIGPSWLIVSRLALASAVLLPLVPWRRIAAQWAAGEIGWGDAGRVLAGALIAAYIVFVMQFEGLALTTASSAALLVAVAPPLLAVGAAVVDGERAGRTAWIAIALSALGIVLLVGAPGPGRSLLGDALCAGSMVGAVGWTLISRRVGHRIGALPAMAFQFALGGLLLLPFAFWREGPPPLLTGAALWSILFLGVACTAVTFVLFTWGVMRVEAARAGVISNVEPVVGSVLGVVFLGERLGPWSLVGGVLLVAAALLATRAETVVVPDTP